MEFGSDPTLMPVIDWFLSVSGQNPVEIAWFFVSHGLWIIIVIMFARALYDLWLDGRQGQYVKKTWNPILLAIDVPKNNEQTPKAVESVFAAVAAAQKNPNLIDKYWEGYIQEYMSFEIVSLEGYTQYLIRCNKGTRDLIEAAIYAQYPDAEITEVADYTEPYKSLRFPNAEYNLWGTEFMLTRDYPYPIRSYSEFEHTLTQTMIDPMAGLMEILSRFGPGEQVWLQLVVTPMPAGDGWGDKAEKVVKKMTGQTYEPKKTFLDSINDVAESTGNLVSEFIDSAMGGVPAVKKDEKKDWNLQKLSPGEKNVLEKIQNKLSKHRFGFKFRLVYLGKNEVFNKGKGISGVISAIQQFNTSDANGFKPGKRTKTASDYFRTKERTAVKQNTILRQYVSRTNFYGEDTGNQYLCTEELASLWHFPIMTVKASNVEKMQSKKVAPPPRLPYKTRGFVTKTTKEISIIPGLPEVSPPAADTPKMPSISLDSDNAKAPADLPVIDAGKPPVRQSSAPPPNLPTI